MKSNSSNRHIKDHLEATRKLNEPVVFENVKRVDFELEVEHLRYSLDRLNARLDAYDNVMENMNFAILVIHQMLEDKKLVTQDDLQAAAQTVARMKIEEKQKFEQTKQAAYAAFLFSNDVSPANA